VLLVYAVVSDFRSIRNSNRWGWIEIELGRKSRVSTGRKHSLPTRRLVETGVLSRLWSVEFKFKFEIRIRIVVLRRFTDDSESSADAKVESRRIENTCFRHEGLSRLERCVESRSLNSNSNLKFEFELWSRRGTPFRGPLGAWGMPIRVPSAPAAKRVKEDRQDC